MGWTSRRELLDRKDRLQRLRGLVPERARRFHSAAADVGGQIAAESGVFPWIREARLLEIDDRLARLERTAGELSRLLDEVDTVDRRREGLGGEAARVRDTEALRWFETSLRGVGEELKLVGVNVDRETQAGADRERLRGVELRLQEHDRTLRLVLAAEDLALKLDMREEARDLREALAGVGAALAREGEDAEWRRRLEQAVEAARPLLARLQQPSTASSSIQVVLRQARLWSEALGLPSEAQRALERRRQQLPLDRDDDEEATALLAESREVLNGLVDRGAAERHRRLEDLRARADELVDQTGPQPVLRRAFAELEAGLAVAGPEAHQAWTKKAGEAEHDLTALITSHYGELRARLVEGAEVLLRRVDDDRRQTSTERHRGRLESLAAVLGELTGGLVEEEVLPGLRRLALAKSDYDALHGELEEERRGLDELRSGLRARREALRAASEASGLPFDLGAPVADDEAAPREDLEQAKLAAAVADQQLGERERTFVALVMEASTEPLDWSRRALEVLELGDRGALPAGPPLPPAEMDPAGAAAWLAAVQSGRVEVEEVVTRGLAGLEAVAEAQRDRLRDWLRRDLTAADRRQVEGVLERLTDGALATGGELDRLEARLSIRRDLDELEARLDADRFEARRRRAELLEELRRLQDERLAGHAPELYELASAWVHGAADEPLRWSHVLGQLGDAAELLATVRRHAEKREARRVEELTARLDGVAARDPAAEEERRALREELARRAAELPPWPLRERLERAVGRGGRR